MPRLKFSAGRPSGRFWRLVAVILASIIIGLARYWPSDVPEKVNGVARVVDGDSVRLNGEEIRLVGIDAPEGRQVCRREGKDWRCGVAATKALKTLLRGQRVECLVKGVDKYDRLLAVCYQDELNVNLWMVEQGWAVSYGDYRAEERRAEMARRGIWNSTFDRPNAWREKNLTGSVAAAAS